jgi:aminoglycoside phosphotransferase (APT) family kinase protein
MTEETFDSAALARWLGQKLGAEGLTVSLDGRPSGGFSAETLLLTAHQPGARNRRLVARLETPEPAVYPTQSDLVLPEIEIQFRIMQSLREHSKLPIAPLVGYEPNPDVLGTQFFVMEFVDGVVPIESPPYSVEGFFTSLKPSERTEMISNGLQQLAHLHTVEVASAGLSWLVPDKAVPGSNHLMQLWRAFGEAELRGRHHPLLEQAWTLLESELPADSGIGLCWGDPRPGNIIWQGQSAACLTDFEAACIGPPEFDLGWWLMFDRTMHELAGIDRLPGDPSRDQQREMYFAHANRSPVDTSAQELFAAARYCVIVVRVMNRLDQRGLLPPESDIWRENPATECLRMILNERGEAPATASTAPSF